MNAQREPRSIALVGCGAIADSFYLPYLQKARPADSVVLFDADEARARTAAAKFGFLRISRDYASVLREVSGVILAIPHRLHYALSLQALDQGVHVLVEKPLAPIAEEAAALVGLAQRNRLHLLVNNTRRLFPSYARIRELIVSRTYGAPLEIDWAEGDQFQWPTVSGFYFQRSNQPRGVLLDLGAHAMDALCWWLGAEPDVLNSESDSFGGPEATAHVSMQLDECAILLRLSWLTKQRNTIRVRFERATVEAGVWDWNSLTLIEADGTVRNLGRSGFSSYKEFAAPLLSNFCGLIDGEKGITPCIKGSDVLPSLNLLDTCYEKMRRFALPWYSMNTVPAKSGVSPAKIKAQA